MAHVIVAVDGSRLSMKAFTVGRRIIEDHGKITLLHAAGEKSTVKDTTRSVISISFFHIGCWSMLLAMQHHLSRNCALTLPMSVAIMNARADWCKSSRPCVKGSR